MRLGVWISWTRRSLITTMRLLSFLDPVNLITIGPCAMPDSGTLPKYVGDASRARMLGFDGSSEPRRERPQWIRRQVEWAVAKNAARVESRRDSRNDNEH